MRLLRIGEVARRCALGIETIRFYERKRLLEEPTRRPSGYRQYDESVVARLQFIRRTKSLGFTLGEIGQLLALWFNPNTGCHYVRERAAGKIAEIDERIKCLQNMRRSLKKLTNQCERRGTLEACPLFDGLGNGSSKKERTRKATTSGRQSRRGER